MSTAEVSSSTATSDPTSRLNPNSSRGSNPSRSNRGRNQNRNRNRNNAAQSEASSADHNPSASSSRGGGRSRGRNADSNVNGESARGGRGNGRGNRGNNRRGRGGTAATPSATSTSRPQSRASTNNGDAQDEPVKEQVGSSRRRQFGGKLTQTSEAQSSTSQIATSSSNPPTGPKSSKKPNQKGKNPQSQSNPQPKEFADLRSRLVAELSSGQYECSICYSTITTKQSIWSCDKCYSVLHLPCAKKWSSTSVKQMEDLNSMQEDPNIRNKRGSWRCPSCQYSREIIPKDYSCWCGRINDPSGSKGNPHSCGQRCGKTSTGCEHGGCPEQCHPGPCSKCAVTISKSCFCGKTAVPVRCSQLESSNSSGISCLQACGKLLNCSLHSCSLPCHDGPCDACEESSIARCYCGNHQKELKCGEGEAKISRKKSQVEATSINETQVEEWQGRFSCQQDCKRPFKCGKHYCRETCHPQELEAADCPRDPKFHSNCPCGATKIQGRTSCSDPIITCSNVCNKTLSCGHSCSEKCHLEDCPPCRVPVSSPCRCSETLSTLPCHERQKEESEGQQEVLCNTLCRALRTCLKHECRRRCCPLYFQAKNKSKTRPSRLELEESDPAGLHHCDVVCGKPTSCGLHSCPMTCHRGACPPCLQASFEELVCHCGRTTLEPPIPCGTQVVCNFPCRRPGPSCGHPQLPHNCHQTEGCPPCVHLTERLCDCGKNVVKNIPCSRSRVSCGTVCGALLGCGYHRCQSICCKGDCGSCTQVCGKPKRKCQHPCLLSCHAPMSCPEDEPCTATITILCQCGNLQQRVSCGSNREKTLKCNDSCLLAQRNARLAEALGINKTSSSTPTTYTKEILTFYGHNSKFCKEIETQMVDFIRSPMTAKVLAPSKQELRKFIHEYANEYFHLMTESLDQEPRRSVSIRRSKESKVPTTLLSEAWEKAKNELNNERNSSVSLGQLKRGVNLNSNNNSNPSSSTSATFIELPKFNSILLEQVFGYELESLKAFLNQTLRPISNFKINYLDEDNVIISSIDLSTNPNRLNNLRNDLRLLVKKSNGTIKNVWLASLDGNGNLIRREDQPMSNPTSNGTSTSVWGRNSNLNSIKTPSSQIGNGEKKFVGGWAAVASSNPRQNPSNNSNGSSSAWRIASSVKETVTSQQRLAALNQNQSSTSSSSGRNLNSSSGFNTPTLPYGSGSGSRLNGGLDSRAPEFVPREESKREESVPEDWDASLDE